MASRLGIAVTPSPGPRDIFVLNAPTPDVLKSDVAARALAIARAGGTLVLRGLTPESVPAAQDLLGISLSVRSERLFHCVRAGRPALLDGLSTG